MENSTSWSIWSICACKFIRSSNLISWIIKKLFVLGLFQPRPPWTLEWCRCWDCCGWSWSYHLKLNTLAKKQREKNLDERKTYRVDHPGWLLRQLALDSPSCTFLADEPSRKNRIEIWIAICLSIRFDHQSLPHFLGLSLILKPTQCFETTLDFIYDYMILDMRPPCVWKLFPQPPYQGLLNLLVRNWLIPNIQNGQNFQYGQNVQKVQTSWSVSVTKSLAALFSVT